MQDMTPEKSAQFVTELENLVNRYSWDSALDMPDFLIASLIYTNLDTLKRCHEANAQWHTARTLKED